jgi:hypothetical protein
MAGKLSVTIPRSPSLRPSQWKHSPSHFSLSGSTIKSNSSPTLSWELIKQFAIHVAGHPDGISRVYINRDSTSETRLWIGMDEKMDQHASNFQIDDLSRFYSPLLYNSFVGCVKLMFYSVNEIPIFFTWQEVLKKNNLRIFAVYLTKCLMSYTPNTTEQRSISSYVIQENASLQELVLLYTSHEIKKIENASRMTCSAIRHDEVLFSKNLRQLSELITLDDHCNMNTITAGNHKIQQCLWKTEATKDSEYCQCSVLAVEDYVTSPLYQAICMALYVFQQMAHTTNLSNCCSILQQPLLLPPLATIARYFLYRPINPIGHRSVGRVTLEADNRHFYSAVKQLKEVFIDLYI